MGHANAPLKTTPTTWRKDLDRLDLAMLRAFRASPSMRGKEARAVAQKAGFSPHAGERCLRRVRATFGLTPKRATGKLVVTDRERWDSWSFQLHANHCAEIDPPEEKPFELPPAPEVPEPAPEVPAPAPNVLVDDQVAFVEHDGKIYGAPIPEEAEPAGQDPALVPSLLRIAIRNLQRTMAEHGVQSVTVTPDEAEVVKVEVKVTARKLKVLGGE